MKSYMRDKMLLVLLLALALAGCKIPPPPAAAFPAQKARLQQIGSLAMEKAREVEFLGDTAFIAQNLLGMSTADVRDAHHPVLRHHFPPELIQPLHLQILPPRLLVVADRFRGLVVWDVLDRDQPTSLSQLALPGIATHLNLFTRSARLYAAVACGGEGLCIVEITNPSAPRLAGRFRLDIDYSRAITVAGRYGFLADNLDGGMKLLDLARPENPSLIQKILLPGFCERVRIRDGLVLGAYRTYGTQILRLNPPDKLSPPTLSYLCRTTLPSPRVHDALALPNAMVVANDTDGVELYDLSTPERPVLMDAVMYSPPAAAQSCAWHKGNLYVSSWDGGLRIFQIAYTGSPSRQE